MANSAVLIVSLKGSGNKRWLAVKNIAISMIRIRGISTVSQASSFGLLCREALRIFNVDAPIGGQNVEKVHVLSSV